MLAVAAESSGWTGSRSFTCKQHTAASASDDADGKKQQQTGERRPTVEDMVSIQPHTYCPNGSYGSVWTAGALVSAMQTHLYFVKLLLCLLLRDS